MPYPVPGTACGTSSCKIFTCSGGRADPPPPIFVTVLEPFNVDLAWFGIVTIIAVEVGLLTPPLGLAVYVIKSTLNRDDISLADIFIGAAPYAATMLIVLTLIIIFPEISLWLVEQARELRRT